MPEHVIIIAALGVRGKTGWFLVHPITVVGVGQFLKEQIAANE